MRDRKSIQQILSELKQDLRTDDNYLLLFNRFYARLYSFFRHKGFPPEDCPDLVQTVFITVHKGIKGVREDADFQSWLFAIASNVYRDELRRKRARKRQAREVWKDRDFKVGNESVEVCGIGGTASTPLDILLEKERRVELSEALQALPDQMRRCVELRLSEGLSGAEIADRLGVSINTVKAHIHQARNRLTEILRGYVE
jgi:RNA polymerase sigma-70 factor (ECF subfamily)